MNATSAITPAAAAAARRMRVHAGESDSTIASVIAPTATMSSAMPTTSTLRRVSVRGDAFRRYTPHHNEMAPNDRKKKKAQNQPTDTTTKEPKQGPTAAANPPTAPHRLTV